MKYITILRGINVGGHKKILMADLKALLNQLGLINIATYIQSGNVIFEATEKKDVLEQKITKVIYENYGFDVPVIVIPTNVFEKLAVINPYLNNTAVEKLHVTFLKESPNKEYVKNLESVEITTDKFIIIDQAVFLAIDNKYHKSKLSNNFFEKRLKVTATTRNWKTITKLIELSCK